MQVLAMSNIENEIILDKLYECLEDSEKGYLITNELGESKLYDRLLFGVLPIENEIATK